MELIEILATFTVDDLKKCLKLLPLSAKRPARKADIIDVIANHVLTNDIKNFWQKLDKLEQSAVAEALYNNDGYFSASRFKAKYNELPKHFVRTDYYASYALKQKKEKASYLRLFFFLNQLPTDLQVYLCTFVPKPAEFDLSALTEQVLPETLKVNQYDEYPVMSRQMEASAHHELVAILRLIDDQKITVSDKTSVASAASIRKIDDILLEGDFYPSSEDQKSYAGGKVSEIRSYAWPLLIQNGGLAKRDGKKLSLTKNGKKALGGYFAESIRDLFLRWLKKGLLDEFRRIDMIKGQAGKGRRMTAVAARRQVIVDALKTCPTNEWLEIDIFARYLQIASFDFEVVHTRWKLYLADSHYGHFENAEWSVFQFRYVMVFLFEYMATLGLIDVGYVSPKNARNDYRDLWGADDLAFLSRYDGLRYFRINPLGAYCLGLNQEYNYQAPIKPVLLQITDDLLLTLLRQPAKDEHLVLRQYAKPMDNNHWQLSPDKLLDAKEQGYDLSLFYDFLKNYTDQTLPDEVNDLFEECLGRSNALQLDGAVSFIRCSSIALAKMIANDPLTQKYCLLAGEKNLVVPNKQQTQFRQGLRQLGYIFPQETL